MLEQLEAHQRTINVVCGIAVGVVVLRFLLLSIDEVVPFGAELGDLLSDAGLALGTAWLFQWLVVLRPERARLSASNRVMAPRVDDLVRVGRQLVYMMRRTTGSDSDVWPPARDEIVTLCKAIDPRKPPKEFLASSWWPYLQYIQRRRGEAQRALEPYYDRMDVELLSHVTAERDAGGMLRIFEPGWPLPTGDSLVPWAVDIDNWTKALDSIRTHREVLVPSVPPDDGPK
ncbi:hypothetical protein [Knoellia koreensis]|uniref:Uncharacterized protein n=1 Tax=Knoellia koreensis TaxID=2730921 RepID=A0A849HDP8_9MICO|nr:hypothetical protein [Knoellia sp. DB2414S]NNM45229.1 hypothetical protein [Knoellia sp. DB2414S]